MTLGMTMRHWDFKKTFQVGVPDLANNSTGCLVKFKFQINNNLKTLSISTSHAVFAA